jgi:type II secretory pathway predicted ATPase ExeA/Tfp pilus assembly protein PilF
MYLSYYNLSDWPFRINSDPRFLWLGEKYKEALATLIYGVQEQRGFLLLTGDVGTGKTTLVNALLQQLDESILVGNITNPKLSMIGLLDAVSASLGSPELSRNRGDFLLHFKRFLNEKYVENKHVLLIIDEAHTLSKRNLEQIRLLSNIELPEGKLMSIFLVGQNELNQTLTSYECRALRQRISLICRVEPLSEGETSEYIRHRLKIAGTQQELFSHATVRKIQRFSRGYPRLINILCDRALLTGYARELRRITPSLIKECGQEMLLPGESIEYPVGAPSKNLEQLPSSPSGEQSEESEQERLRQSGRGRDEHYPRILELWSGLRVRSNLHWAMGASAVLIILFFTVISQTDLFSWRDTKQTSLSANGPPSVQSVFSSSTAAPPSVETPTAEHEAPEINAVPVPVKVEPKDLPRDEAASDISAQAQETHPAGEAMPKTKGKSIVDSVEDALRQRDFKQAVDLSEKIMVRDESPPPRLKALYSEALLNQAEILFRKEPISSEELLNKAISADPKNFKALLLLGKLYTGQNQYGKALETYQKAALLNPDMPGLLFNLGFLYAAKGDYALAEDEFTRAIELSPPYLDKALFNLAVVQEKQGKRDASLQSLKKALDVNPNNQKARDLLKRVTGE